VQSKCEGEKFGINVEDVNNQGELTIEHEFYYLEMKGS